MESQKSGRVRRVIWVKSPSRWSLAGGSAPSRMGAQEGRGSTDEKAGGRVGEGSL